DPEEGNAASSPRGRKLRAHPRCGCPGDTPGPFEGRSKGETVMDAVVKPWPKATDKAALSDHVPQTPRPSRQEAEAAVRTLIAFAGDDPGREGLLDTPK